MSVSVSPRELRSTFHPAKWVLCIALGIWLGFVAIALTLYLLYKALPPEQAQTVKNAATQITTPAPTAAKPKTESPMFDQYQQNLRESEARQAQEAEKAERQRSFNGAKCQFWMQQDQTAPSEKSRASIYQFCG